MIISATPAKLTQYLKTQEDRDNGMWNGHNWDGRTWVFTEDWSVHIKTATYEIFLTIRKGFKTDGGSIPPPADTLIRPMGMYLLAWLVHDAIYAAELMARVKGDWVMLEILQHQRMGWFLRNGVYCAVEAGGAAVWASHRPSQVARDRELMDFKYIGEVPRHLINKDR